LGAGRDATRPLGRHRRCYGRLVRLPPYTVARQARDRCQAPREKQ
jgi:hypothetical protein